MPVPPNTSFKNDPSHAVSYIRTSKLLSQKGLAILIKDDGSSLAKGVFKSLVEALGQNTAPWSRSVATESGEPVSLADYDHVCHPTAFPEKRLFLS